MHADNPMTERYLVSHPDDAARVLQNFPPEYCVTFLEAIDDDKAVRLLHFLLPAYLGQCFEFMSAGLLNASAEHALNEVCLGLLSLPEASRQAVIGRLASGHARQVGNRLRYPSDTVARFFKAPCPAFSINSTVGEALKQLEHMHYEDGCPLNLVNEHNRLQGSIDTTRLLNAAKKEHLHKLLSPQKRPQILISSRLTDIENHKGWLNHRQLPVVDRDGVYLGELDYETLQSVQQAGTLAQTPVDAVGNILSLAGVYWLSASWLLDSLVDGISKPHGGD